MDKRYYSRKFIVSMYVATAAVGLRIGGFIDAAQMVELLRWAMGLYMAGNVGDTWAEKK